MSLKHTRLRIGTERARNFVDDPAHAWIRDTWADQEIDPRLSMTKARRHA